MVAANPSIEKKVRDAIIYGITIAENCKKETKPALVISYTKILQVLNSFDFLKYQKQVEDELKIKKFLKNYMTLFETLIMFIRANRQQNWELHLASLHCLCKYFSLLT